jgi:sugar phosphate isomerase/epimerase
MQRALSTHLLVNHRLTTVWLERILDIGVGAVEIFCARQHFDFHDKAQINELTHWFRDADLELFSLHLPMYSDDVWGRSGPHAVLDITEPSKARRIEVVDEIKRALEVGETIPCRYAVQHVGVARQEWDERRFEGAFSAIEEISLFAKQRGMKVLLENIPNAYSSAERLLQFLELTHLDFDFCFDTGHAHMMEGLETAFERMKPRIRSTHVHDNDGKNDLHLFPLVPAGGTVDWNRAMDLLRGCPGQYPLLLELKEQPEIESPLRAVAEAFERLERAGRAAETAGEN